MLLNGFFVAAEFSLARARLTRLDQMAADGVGSAELAGRQARQIDRYLAACQLGITLASLGLGWLGEPAFAHLAEPLLQRIGLGDQSAPIVGGILAFTIITALHVVVGELAPKNLALQRPEVTVRAVAHPLEWFRVLLSPLIAVLNGAGNRIIGVFGIEPATESELASTPEDLQRLIAQSEEGGTIEPEEADMLEGVFALGDRIARDVMTPRPEVCDLSADLPVRAALEEALSTRHSRFPVTGGDGVLGVVHLSDLAVGALTSEAVATVKSVTNPAFFVPETQPVDDLLRELQRRRTSLAVVLDEYGELSGLVTVEDIIEEIVGEIDDERDRAPAVDEAPDGRLIVRGHVPLEDLVDHGVEVEDETVTSVGGLVFARLGRLPRTGDSVAVGGWRFTVEATRGTRVVLVAVEPEPHPHADPAADEQDRSGRNGHA
ncbi:MAG: HlyC/CorC family transporter [Thermoleophilia bacterium]|nr:HlyC/CorC family transporter [Thermoleophilia bacterium]